MYLLGVEIIEPFWINHIYYTFRILYHCLCLYIPTVRSIFELRDVGGRVSCVWCVYVNFTVNKMQLKTTKMFQRISHGKFILFFLNLYTLSFCHISSFEVKWSRHGKNIHFLRLYLHLSHKNVDLQSTYPDCR